MNKSIICKLMLLSFSFSLSLSSPVSATTFSTIYNGEEPDHDANHFRSLMNQLGYTELMFKTTYGKNPADSIYPTGHDIVNADIANFLYISGHGLNDGELLIGSNEQPTDSVAASHEANLVYTYPTTGLTTHYNPDRSPAVIGVGWADTSGSFTTSWWDQNLKWAFIAGCGQLNYGSQGEGNFFEGGNSAHLWARTMLGYQNDSTGAMIPHRVHGINGYYGIGPAGSNDDLNIQGFFAYAVDGGPADPDALPILDSWATANSDFIDSTWAVLVNQVNRHDYLPGQKSGLTNDSTGIPTIDVYQYQQTSFYKNNFQSRSLVPKVQNSKINLPHFITDGKRKFKIHTSSVTNNVYQSTPLQIITASSNDLIAIGKKILGDGIVEGQFEGKHVMKNGSKSFLTDKNGKVKFADANLLLGSLSEVSFNEDQAVTKAESFLRNYGLLPQDAKVKRIFKTVRVNDILGTTPKEEVLEYSVVFGHEYQGKEIGGDLIQVDVNEIGIRQMRYQWSKVDDNISITKNNVLTPDQALEYFKKNVNKVWKFDKDQYEITNIELIYHRQKNSNILLPVWKFEIDYGFPVYVDAFTGDLVDSKF